MVPITVIILLKNNINKENIQSIFALNPKQILLGAYTPINIKGVKTIEIKETNYSKALNQLQELAETDWILFLKENETILQVNEDVESLIQKDEIYGLQILSDDVIMKEPRLWNKNRKINFKNPVFEKLAADPTKITNIILYQQKIEEPKVLPQLDLWKKTQPLSVDACYYKAFDNLAKRNFIEFIRLISHYLFNAKSDIPSIMARYYLALIQGIIQNEMKEAIHNIVLCIAENPLMAEFWCLLGDLFTKMDKFKEAIIFYENAIILGGRRLSLDKWPMHISKYQSYPQEMMDKCKVIIDKSKVYKSGNI